MPTMMKLSEVEVITREGRKEETPPRITTTLYALIATLQDVVGPDDALVIATVEHLLRAGRLTLHDTNMVNLLEGAPTPTMGDRYP